MEVGAHSGGTEEKDVILDFTASEKTSTEDGLLNMLSMKV